MTMCPPAGYWWEPGRWLSWENMLSIPLRAQNSIKGLPEFGLDRLS